MLLYLHEIGDADGRRRSSSSIPHLHPLESCTEARRQRASQRPQLTVLESHMSHMCGKCTKGGCILGLGLYSMYPRIERLTCSQRLLKEGLICLFPCLCLSTRKYSISMAWTMRLNVGVKPLAGEIMSYQPALPATQSSMLLSSV